MTIVASFTGFLVLILLLTNIDPSQQCLLHDMINSTSNGYGKLANINNATLSDIFQKSRTLLQEIPDGNGILVQLNTTGTNISTLALIVENNFKNHSTGDIDILQHYRMYYVTLQHEQIGYRLYFKLMREYIRNQMSVIYQTLSSSVNSIGRFWRPTNPKHDDNSATITETSLMLPVLMKTVDVPSRIEERVFEIVTGNQTFKSIDQEKNVTEKIMNEPNEKAYGSMEMLRLLMKVISAFRGNFVPNKPALVKHGIIITDKNVKITINAEQKVSGDIDLFIGDPSSNNKKQKPQTN